LISLAESIGERIKTLRTGQGLTLAELGEKANLSISYLSQIERDKTSPSLTTLETIAKSLNIGLRYFFETDDEATFVLRANKETNKAIQGDSILRQLLVPQTGNPLIEVHRIKFPAHFGPEYIEQFAGEEIIYVLDGELNISIGDEQFVLAAGDSIHYDALLIHSWMNQSSNSCTMIWGRAQSLPDYQPSSTIRSWNKNPENGN
jgi:transcriptional regulator with XRE-family HTH domain